MESTNQRADRKNQWDQNKKSDGEVIQNRANAADDAVQRSKTDSQGESRFKDVTASPRLEARSPTIDELIFRTIV